MGDAAGEGLAGCGVTAENGAGEFTFSRVQISARFLLLADLTQPELGGFWPPVPWGRAHRNMQTPQW